jgi:hypothetical protein
MIFCEQSKEPWGSIKGGEFLDHLRYCQLIDELSSVE